MVQNWTEEFHNLKKLAEVTLAGGYMQSETKIQHETLNCLRNETYCMHEKSFHDSTQKMGNYNWEENCFNGEVHAATRKYPRRNIYSNQRNYDIKSTYNNQTLSYSHKLFDKKKSRNIITDSCVIQNEIHSCAVCGKKYSSSSNLARHRQTHRSIQDKKARRCPFCDKIYVSIPAFSMHVRTHSSGFKCSHCEKKFSRPWLLQGHMRTHTGEKPFHCHVCSKAFADKSNLRAHVQTHSNYKPHTCEICKKSFALKSYLYKHEESSCQKKQVKNNNYSKICFQH